MYGLVRIIVTISMLHAKRREPRVEGGNPGRGGNFLGLGGSTGTFNVLWSGRASLSRYGLPGLYDLHIVGRVRVISLKANASPDHRLFYEGPRNYCGIKRSEDVQDSHTGANSEQARKRWRKLWGESNRL